MKRISSGSRRIGGSGSRGLSSSSGGFKRSSGSSSRKSIGFSGSRNTFKSGYSHTRHHSNFRRSYGNSIIPFWVRVLFVLAITILYLLFS